MTKAAKRASGSKAKPRYKRVLFKVSGEALMGSQSFGIDPKMTARIARDVKQAVGLGVRVALVVGGGNIFRGVALAAGGADRVTGDHMGMLATVMNAKALKMALSDAGMDAVVLSAVDMPAFARPSPNADWRRIWTRAGWWSLPAAPAIPSSPPILRQPSGQAKCRPMRC